MAKVKVYDEDNHLSGFAQLESGGESSGGPNIKVYDWDELEKRSGTNFLSASQALTLFNEIMEGTIIYIQNYADSEAVFPCEPVHLSYFKENTSVYALAIISYSYPEQDFIYRELYTS